MLKKLAIYSLLIVLLVQTSGKLAVLGYYTLNKKYITDNLCVNRSKPTMHCNGKCHLAKELSKEEKRQQSPTNPLKEETEQVLFTETNNLSIALLPAEIKTVSSYYLLVSYTSILNTAERPPC